MQVFPESETDYKKGPGTRGLEIAAFLIYSCM
jgi:hypothetical protein